MALALKSQSTHSTSRPRYRRIAPGRPKSNESTRSIFIGLTAALIFVLVSWVCVVNSSHRPLQQPRVGVPAPIRGQLGKKDGSGRRSLHREYHTKGSGSAAGYHRLRPRVVGIYAYQIRELKGGMGKDVITPYIYLAERIDPYLLSHASQTLRRRRQHNYYNLHDIALSEIVHNYKLAIAGSIGDVRTEDPLRHLMLTSASRDTLRNIQDNSWDYKDGLAEPLNNRECEATPKNSRWMLHSFPTCNHLHEFDIMLSMRKDETMLLGHGYWRDVWPVLDFEPSARSLEKKVALKTIRWEHDYDERNFHRHVRDAIVSERLTSSPWVTSTYAFCGNSGYFEFATGGSLANRLEEHYAAKVGEENERKSDSNDDRILTQGAKLGLAHEAASGLADFHDTDAMRNEKGEIISASMVHADITTDQFVLVDGVYKLNDFNRCRFMRRYRGSAKTKGGDGKPCGFKVSNNPGKSRAPEEYAYSIETEKIDVFSLGNVLYSILMDGLDAWEDTDSKKAQQAIMKGNRPKIPKGVKSSTDFVDVALRKIMWRCWAHKPEDRPRARAVADFLARKLEELDGRDGKNNH